MQHEKAADDTCIILHLRNPYLTCRVAIASLAGASSSHKCRSAPPGCHAAAVRERRASVTAHAVFLPVRSPPLSRLSPVPLSIDDAPPSPALQLAEHADDQGGALRPPLRAHGAQDSRVFAVLTTRKIPVCSPSFIARARAWETSARAVVDAQ